MTKILFVCLGNICRSPMAEAVLRHKLKEKNLVHQIEVNSAATSHWEVGSIPHIGTQRILRANEISFEGIKATQITKKDFETYDLLIGMDQKNITDLQRLAPVEMRGKIHLFMEKVPTLETVEVPDPYYTGNFEQTYQLINQGTEAWLMYIQEENSKISD